MAMKEKMFSEKVSQIIVYLFVYRDWFNQALNIQLKYSMYTIFNLQKRYQTDYYFLQKNSFIYQKIHDRYFSGVHTLAEIIVLVIIVGDELIAVAVIIAIILLSA